MKNKNTSKPFSQKIAKTKHRPIDIVGDYTKTSLKDIKDLNKHLITNIKNSLEFVELALNKQESYRDNYYEYKNAPLNKEHINWEINQMHNALLALIKCNNLNEKEAEDKQWEVIERIKKQANIAMHEYVGATYTVDSKDNVKVTIAPDGKWLLGSKAKSKEWWGGEMPSADAGIRTQFIKEQLSKEGLE